MCVILCVQPVDPSTQPVASEESEAGKRISKEVKLGGNESPDNRPIKPGIGTILMFTQFRCQ